jgi:hypothetical protein
MTIDFNTVIASQDLSTGMRGDTLYETSSIRGVTGHSVGPILSVENHLKKIRRRRVLKASPKELNSEK